MVMNMSAGMSMITYTRVTSTKTQLRNANLQEKSSEKNNEHRKPAQTKNPKTLPSQRKPFPPVPNLKRNGKNHYGIIRVRGKDLPFLNKRSFTSQVASGEEQKIPQKKKKEEKPNTKPRKYSRTSAESSRPTGW